jgi:D-alanyl-D-alanine carboxypeptidase (penicillin-binding protein 5/6)
LLQKSKPLLKSIYCVVGTARRDGLQIIAVTLGAGDNNTRIGETMKILDYGFNKYMVLRRDE